MRPVEARTRMATCSSCVPQYLMTQRRKTRNLVRVLHGSTARGRDDALDARRLKHVETWCHVNDPPGIDDSRATTSRIFGSSLNIKTRTFFIAIKQKCLRQGTYLGTGSTSQSGTTGPYFLDLADAEKRPLVRTRHISHRGTITDPINVYRYILMPPNRNKQLP